MANITVQTPNQSALYTVAKTVIAPFAAFWNMLVRTSEAGSRVHIIERMNNLTDRELADQYGINRDQIPSYVFRDMMYL